MKAQIIKVPEGSAPENIRKEWVGIILEVVRMPEYRGEMDFLTGAHYPNRRGFLANSCCAISAIRQKSLEAARWFEENLPVDNRHLCFGPDEMEILR